MWQCAVFVRQITTYVVWLPHVIHMPRLDGEFKIFHVIALSAKKKHTAESGSSPFPVCSHSRISPTGTGQQLSHELMEISTLAREPLAEALPTPLPLFFFKNYLKKKWTNRQDCIRWAVGPRWTDEKIEERGEKTKYDYRCKRGEVAINTLTVFFLTRFGLTGETVRISVPGLFG